jgi:hypothetical protein
MITNLTEFVGVRKNEVDVTRSHIIRTFRCFLVFLPLPSCPCNPPPSNGYWKPTPSLRLLRSHLQSSLTLNQPLRDSAPENLEPRSFPSKRSTLRSKGRLSHRILVSESCGNKFILSVTIYAMRSSVLRTSTSNSRRFEGSPTRLW